MSVPVCSIKGIRRQITLPSGNVSQDTNAKQVYSEKCCTPDVYRGVGNISDGRYLGLLRYSTVLKQQAIFQISVPGGSRNRVTDSQKQISRKLGFFQEITKQKKRGKIQVL